MSKTRVNIDNALFDKLKTSTPAEPAAEAAPKPEPQPVIQKVVPVYQSKRSTQRQFVGWIDKNLHNGLQVEAADQDTTIQDLITEGILLLFEQRGIKQQADGRWRRR